MNEHWAHKSWDTCSFIEKAKTVLLWSICIVATLAVIVGMFFLKSYRWGNCG